MADGGTFLVTTPKLPGDRLKTKWRRKNPSWLNPGVLFDCIKCFWIVRRWKIGRKILSRYLPKYTLNELISFFY